MTNQRWREITVRSIGVAALLIALSAPSARSASSSTPGDTSIYPKPYPAPTLPIAGGSFIDPTFGTKITRITDPSNAPSWASVNSAATDSMFNADGSVFYVLQGNPGNTTVFYSLDHSTGNVARLGQLSGNFDGSPWDPTDPSTFYYVTMDTVQRQLWQTKLPLPGTNTMLHDFSGEIPAGGYPNSRVQVSADSRYFGVVASTTGGQDTYDYVVVWDRQTNQSKVLNTVARFGQKLHSLFLDNSGTFAIVQTADYSKRYVWNWATDTVSAPLGNGGPEYFGGHLVPGSGGVINPPGISSTTWALRSLTNPQTFSSILTYPQKNGKVDWFEDSHSSRRLSNGSFFSSLYAGSGFCSSFVSYSRSTYKLVGYLALNVNYAPPEEVRYHGSSLARASSVPAAPGQWFYESATDTLFVWLPDGSNPQSTCANLAVFDWRPLMEEIVQIVQQQDGTWSWRRLAHHRSQYDGWTTGPRANVDPTGSFVLFQSNWDGSPRTDVFLLQVPPLGVPSLSSTPTPTPTPVKTPTPTPTPTPDTDPPSVVINSPFDGATVSGTVNATVSVTDFVGGIVGDILVDENLVASFSGSSANYNWNTASLADGAHTLKSRAEDAAGKVGYSAPVAVTVNNGDRIPPTVSITYPASGTSFTSGSVINITADASDNVGVSRVQSFVNSKRICSDTSPPYVCSWRLPSRAGGKVFQIEVRASDAAGGTSSATVKVFGKNR